MTHETETILRTTLTCDGCGNKVIYERTEDRPNGWHVIQHPNWDMGRLVFCSLECAQPTVAKAVAAEFGA